jgi:VWFA-related protein
VAGLFLLVGLGSTIGLAPGPLQAQDTPKAAAKPGGGIDGTDAPAVVRLLLPPGRKLEGKAEVEALLIDPEIRELVFRVDGEEVARRSKPPWKAKLRFADPAERQTVTVHAYGARDRLLGEDSREVNRFERRFRIRFQPPEQVEGGLRARGEVTLPRSARLARLELALGTDPPIDVEGPVFDRILEPAPGSEPLGPRTFVRATATLEDGRTVDNVAFLGGDFFQVDVNLVQLQVLATERSGPPIRDLEADDFALREGRTERKIDRLELAEDVPLVLGLVIDSSTSMQPLWPSVRAAVDAFVDHALGARDRAFLVDFDTHVRLVSPLSPPGEAAKDTLRTGLDSIRPEGLTALYDSVAFSMLQFQDVPGRRALVLITDGADYGSHSDPERSVELGRKLGIPVYVVSLQQPERGLGRSGGSRAIRQGAATADLHLLADPTGGRVLRTGRGGGPGSGLDRAFGQVAAELRSQYLLTFYTPTDLEDLDPDALRLELPGHPKAEIRALLPLDRVR